MKNFKIILSFICLFAFANIATAQSAKLKQKAADKVEQLNQTLVSVNPDLALTAEQVEKITALEIKKLVGMKEIKKSEATAEEMKEKKKALRQEVSKEINKNILTKEQRKAKKEAKAAAKGN